MKIGNLRNFIELAHPTGDTGTDGSALQYDGAYASNVPAEVKDLSGMQRDQARTSWSEVTTRVEIRWMPGVVQNDQITFAQGNGGATRYFNVLDTLDPDNGKQLRLHIMAKELSNGS